MNILVFDIETIPDIEGGQAVYHLKNLDDKSTAKAMFHLRKQKTGNDFLPLYLQKIAAISVITRGMGDDMEPEITVESLGDHNASEKELLNLFFDKIHQRTPTLVSWNGSAFDLPVIHYRALKNKVSAPSYWEKGENKSAFQYDNYLSRNHERHTDLKDVLASYLSHAVAPLDEISLLLGLPGKMGMDGSQVWEEYLKGNFEGIRNYCETDVLNTYLIYLRYEFMRGSINEEALENECHLLRDFLDKSGQNHLLEFSKNWAK